MIGAMALEGIVTWQLLLSAQTPTTPTNFVAYASTIASHWVLGCPCLQTEAQVVNTDNSEAPSKLLDIMLRVVQPCSQKLLPLTLAIACKNMHLCMQFHGSTYTHTCIHNEMQQIRTYGCYLNCLINFDQVSTNDI